MRLHLVISFVAVVTAFPAQAEECWSPDRYYGCLVDEGVIAVWHGSGTSEALAAADSKCADPGPPPSAYSKACGEYADTRSYVRQKAIDIIDYAANRQAM